MKMSINIENINSNDLKNICRTCMNNCDVKFPQDNIISNIFYKLTDIHFEANDELPQQICQKCFEKINAIHEFSYQCKQTHLTLIKCVNNIKMIRLKQKQNRNTKNKETIECVKIEEVTIDEHEIENVDDDEINSAADFFVDEYKMDQEIKDETNDELHENNMILETSELDINYFQDNLLIPNSVVTNINRNKDDSSNDEYLDDDDLNSSNSSDNSTKKHKVIPIKNRYKCDVCSKTFVYLQSYKKHKKLPSCERPYKCAQCPKAYGYPTDLKRHVRTHSGERPYACSACPMTFTAPKNLKTHLRTHSGEHPYACALCARTFTQSNSLKRHMIMHSGERPFQCPVCGKCFGYSYQMKIHMKLHLK